MARKSAERQAKSSLTAYYNLMSINVLSAVIAIGLGGLKENFLCILLGILWILTPTIMWYISKDIKNVSTEGVHPKYIEIIDIISIKVRVK